VEERLDNVGAQMFLRTMAFRADDKHHRLALLLGCGIRYYYITYYIAESVALMPEAICHPALR
jgi:hypothetical protein